MSLVLCFGCLLIFALLVVFRFGNLAHRMARVGWLAASWRRWIYGERG